MKYLYVVVIGICFSIETFSQSKLTLNDAIKNMLSNNRELLGEQLKIDQAIIQVDNQRNLRLPTLKLSGRISKLSEITPFSLQLNPAMAPVELFPQIENQSAIKLTLNQSLFSGFKTSESIELTEHAAKLLDFDKQAKTTDYIVRLSQVYFSVISGKKMLDIYNKNIELLTQRLQDSERMLSQGLLTENDILKIKIKKNEIELAAIQAIDNLKVSRMNLNILIGDSLNAEHQLVSEYKPLLNDSNQQRPELLGLNEKYETAKNLLHIAKSDYFPTLALQLNYDYANPNQRYIPQQAKWNQTWDINLVMSYDLWTWNTRSNNIEIADLNMRQIENAKNQMTESLNLDLQSNQLAVDHSLKMLDVIKNHVQQSEQSLKMSQAQFKVGMITSSELLDSQIQLLQSELRLEQTQFEYQINRIKLMRSKGILLNSI